MEFVERIERPEVVKDIDYRVEESWYRSRSENEPEIQCFEGAYINESIIRKLCCNEKVLFSSAWSDTHGDNRGPDHHNHSSGITIDMKPINVDKINKLNDVDRFIIRPGLKFREEKNGLIIALSLNGFFVNSIGSVFLRFFREKLNFSLKDVKLLSTQLGLPEETGVRFLKKLLLFGIVGISDD